MKKSTRGKSSSKGNDSPNPIKTVKIKNEKDLFVKGQANEDFSRLPCLEMRILHAGNAHEPQKTSDEVIYKYKSPSEDESITLDVNKMNELAGSEDTNEEVTYEDQEKTVSVKKSLIDNYRLKSNYYGPLRIISEKIKVKEKGVIKEAIQAKLQHVEIQATDNEGQSVNEHELKILMSQTPGIIPACDPLVQTTNEKGYIVLNLGDNEKYKVLKKAMSAFEKLADVKPPFNTKIQKVFTTTDGTVTPVTIVTLYPRVDKVVYQSVLLNEKKQPLKKLPSKRVAGKPKLLNYYRQNYINWAHRGNICFSEIKKVGIDFVDEIFVENPVVEDTLKLLGCSPSTTAPPMESVEANENEYEETEHPVKSKQFVEDLWSYLTTLVRSDDYLIEFEFEMDEEKWLEIKRAFNMFQVNGEVIPDIVLKVVSKKKDDDYELTYYLRCIGRLIKSGPVLSKGDVNDMLKCLSKDKYICIGLHKENFFQQADQNEMLRLHLKDSCYFSVLPFESIHDKKCNAIVRDSDHYENTKMKRGSVLVFGPSVLCQACDSLGKKLKDLLDPSLNLFTPQEVSQRFVKQRYGPVHMTNISENIKNLFTQSPSDFVSGVKRKIKNSAIAENEENLIKQLKKNEHYADIFKDEKPYIKICEDEFEKMVSIKSCSKSMNTLRKECKTCGFQAKSMLSLFVHMNDHLGPLTETCVDCSMKLSSKEALSNHRSVCVHCKKNLVCSQCHSIFSSSEKLFEHMNVHRSVKPFSCCYCELSFQTMNDYKKHLKLFHQINTVKQLNFSCSICHSYFYTNDHLLIHKLNQNHNEKEHFKCKVCNFSCNLVVAFQAHILSHTYEERESNNLATCLQCKKTFFSSFKLVDHIKNKHQTISIDNPALQVQPEVQVSASFSSIECSKCYKSFSTMNALHKHTEVYHSDKVVQAQPSLPLNTCTICTRKFNSEHLLNAHMKLHVANRPVFQCEECGYVYARRTQVLEHIRFDHAEQVEKHQQMQQQQQQQEQHQPQHEMIDTPLYETHPHPGYTETGQVITIANQGQMIQQQQPEQQQPQTDTWNQLKIPSVEQPQETATYQFPNFNTPFF